jgi:putative pyoverdin transport system ATP-binding/permease protein
MGLLDLLKTESAGVQKDMAIAVIASGIANAVILAVINAAASASFGATNFRYLLMFLVAICVYIVGLKYTFDMSTKIFESMIHRVRMRVVEKIANSELMLLDHISKARVFKHITQDTTVISESQGLLVAALHSAVMVLCTAIYILTISPPAFLTTVCFIVCGLTIYRNREREMAFYMTRAAQQEIAFVGLISDLLEGLKEVKINHARGRELIADLDGISDALRESKTQTTNLYNKNAIFSQCFFYVLIAVIVFLLPRWLTALDNVVPKLVAAILFMIGPLSTIVTALPSFAKANAAAESISNLEKVIDQFNARYGAAIASEAHIEFKRIEFKENIGVHALAFQYISQHDNGFAIGPLNVTIEKGKIVMVAGGNGSGKTTFLKLLTALYFPISGSLTVDGMLVQRDNLQSYRELFSAIFSDFHLFEKLYGVGDPSEREVTDLLRLMRIEAKTSFRNGRFTTLDLSAGQRKRLALIVALLEDRPIIVFDEWAAEQDPDFRRFFYEVLLPDLRRRGKTLLLATHDDRYFHIADFLIKMEAGVIAG